MYQEGAVVGGKYRLLRPLGQGGMGAVWAARNEVIGREVAIKVLLPHLASDAEALHRLFTEARICASIRDPGIVDVLDMGTAQDASPFIVMELLGGEPLDKHIRRSGTLAPDAIVGIARDVAQTLALAHEKGVVHRDLKPANVFLHQGPKGQTQVKVLDFGISKVTKGPSQYATREGALLGSPAYMSPEQATGKAIDHRTDIYALGVIMYEALTGRPPFVDAPDVATLLNAIATRQPPPLQSRAPHVPAGVAAIVDRALRLAKEDRYGSATEMAAALDAERAGGAIATSPAAASVPTAVLPAPTAAPSGPPPAPPQAVTTSLSPGQTRRRRVPIVIGAIVGALALGAIGVGGWWLTIGRAEKPKPSKATATSTSVASAASASEPAPKASTAEVRPTASPPATSTPSPPSAPPDETAEAPQPTVHGGDGERDRPRLRERIRRKQRRFP